MLIDFQEQLVLSGFNSKYHMMGNSCCNIQIYNHGLKNQMNNLCFNNMLVTMVRWIILVAILWWIILVAAGKYVFPSTTINQNCRHLQAGAPSNMCSKLFPSRDDCSRNIFLIRKRERFPIKLSKFKTTINQTCRHLWARPNMCTKLFSSGDNCSRKISLIRNALQNKGKDSQSNYLNLSSQ